MNSPDSLPSDTTVAVPSVEKADGSVAEFITEVCLASNRVQHTSSNSSQSHELGAGEYAVMEILDRRGPLTVPQIAHQRCTSRQNIQILADRLALEKRVELLSNPAHKRSMLVRLTEHGKQGLLDGKTGRDQLHSMILSEFSNAELANVLSVLQRLNSLLANDKPSTSKKDKPRVVRGPRPDLQKSEAQVTEPESSSEEFPINLL